MRGIIANFPCEVYSPFCPYVFRDTFLFARFLSFSESPPSPSLPSHLHPLASPSPHSLLSFSHSLLSSLFLLLSFTPLLPLFFFSLLCFSSRRTSLLLSICNEDYVVFSSAIYCRKTRWTFVPTSPLLYPHLLLSI